MIDNILGELELIDVTILGAFLMCIGLVLLGIKIIKFFRR